MSICNRLVFLARKLDIRVLGVKACIHQQPYSKVYFMNLLSNCSLMYFAYLF